MSPPPPNPSYSSLPHISTGPHQVQADHDELLLVELLLLPLLHLDQVRVDQVSDQDKKIASQKKLSTPWVVIIDVLLVPSDLLSERFLHGLQCVQPLKRHLLESL